MMEVKQNTAVDLNDLLTSSKNSVTDEVDDAVMQDLSDGNPSLANCDIIKPNDKPTVIDEIRNGDTEMTSLIKDIDEEVGVDLNTPVNSELEDALLAEDDVSPEVSDSKIIEPTLSTVDDILADKSETSNSTTSSTNNRDPGDDLDTLLSKINDIVEDCIEKEREDVAVPAIECIESVQKEDEIQQDTKVNQCVFEVEAKCVTDDSKKLIEEKTTQITADDCDNVDKSLDLNDETQNQLDEDDSLNPDIDFNLPTPDLEKNGEEENVDEKRAAITKAEANNEKDATQSELTEALIDNNLNLEKTAESIEEVVQDNKITSNSNEIFESVENVDTLPLTTNDNDEIIENPSSDVERNTTVIGDEAKETDESADRTQEQAEEKKNSEEVAVTENAEHDDSDDDIIFYVDKPPEEEKQKAAEDKSLIAEDELDQTKEVVSSPVKENIQDDDDVVLLLDDDDEEINNTKKETQNGKEMEEKNSGEQNETAIISTNENTEAEAKEKEIVIDNSDNARDDFTIDNNTEKEKSVNKTEVTETQEETNSNCSSSSNLLQESKSIKSAVDEITPEDAENEEEEDDGDVELIISDLKELESEKADDSEIPPPAKRIRFSEDNEQDLKKRESCDGSEDLETLNNTEKKQQDSLNNTEQEKSTSATLKRSHDVIELEIDEKSNDSNEGCNKKPKTDIFSKKIDITVDEKQSEDVPVIREDKKDIKAVPSFEPIRLYPAPKLEVLKSELPMSLEYLKKFRKSFDNMTKQDLEELVLQKIVEAIIHKSEFSEMRELIEKQEKLISAHRTKISELSKQFRDLEMVHNRVVKDIEQRNAQFIMPVKITRAVGLQVYIPTKKSLTETATNSISQSIPTSPQRPVSSQASSTSNASLTPPQRQFLSSQTDSQPQRSVATSSTVPVNAGNIRRGCVQKITPIRPVPGTSQTVSSGPSATSSTSYRSTQNHTVSTQPRILNKNATTNQNTTSIQRPRFSGPNQDGQRIATQQVSRPPNIPTNSPRVVANATPSKPIPSTVAPVQRRSEPLPIQTSANSTTSLVDNYLNTLTHLTGGNTAVSITPAKPKEKAVIDLTDEDEAPLQSAGVQPVIQIPASQVQRRSVPTQNTTNSQIHGRPAPNMARVPPANQMANNKNRQMSSMQAQKTFNSISTPPGTSITRINVAPNNSNVQRVKYSHPAPLPATPPQAFNPSWKLPPPRPTIRISNLDNGIVISWTMEESMDRHAECVSYQIYAYQETSGPPLVDSWRHVGDVKAMLLPMAVTLTQFQEGQRYYFAVRAVDCHHRYGPFSLPKTWS